jgi:hypothetical protein
LCEGLVQIINIHGCRTDCPLICDELLDAAKVMSEQNINLTSEDAPGVGDSAIAVTGTVTVFICDGISGASFRLSTFMDAELIVI